MKKLDFKSKKWDKELRNLEDVIKSTNGKFVEFHNLSVLGDFNTLPDKRRYLGAYERFFAQNGKLLVPVYPG